MKPTIKPKLTLRTRSQNHTPPPLPYILLNILNRSTRQSTKILATTLNVTSTPFAKRENVNVKMVTAEMATFVMNTNQVTNQLNLHTNRRTNPRTNLRTNLHISQPTNLRTSLHTSQLTNQPILLRNLILQRNHTTLRKSLIQQNTPNLSIRQSLTNHTILTKIPIPSPLTETARGKHSTDTETAEPGIRTVVRSNILESVENIFLIKSTMMSADGKTQNNSFLCLRKNWSPLELRLKRNLVSNVTGKILNANFEICLL